MRYIKMKNAKPGMCLAYNMYDADGHTLICKGSVLSEFYIEKLYEYLPYIHLVLVMSVHPRKRWTTIYRRDSGKN